MDRIDMILKAESHIKDPVSPLPLDNFEDKLSFKMSASAMLREDLC